MIGKNKNLFKFVNKQSKQIKRVEEKFDKFMEMAEFAPGGPQEANKRFGENVKNI